MSVAGRLESEPNIWLATVRPDGRPHLTPIWFVFHDERLWVCTNSTAVKARNVLNEPRVTISLESGNNPAVAEGVVTVWSRPYPPGVVTAFVAKFDWDISTVDDDGPYDALLEITVVRWVMGGAGS